MSRAEGNRSARDAHVGGCRDRASPL